MGRRTEKGSHKREDDFTALYGPAGRGLFAAVESLRHAVDAAGAGTTLVLGLGKDPGFEQGIIVETCGFGSPITLLSGQISGILVQPQHLLGADRYERQQALAAGLGCVLGPDGLRSVAEDLLSLASSMELMNPAVRRTRSEALRRRMMKRQRGQ